MAPRSATSPVTGTRIVSLAMRRVTTDFPVASNLLRIGSLGDRVLVLADDAAVIEGTLQR